MNLADSRMDCVRGCLATLSLLVVRIALLEYSKIHEKAYKCIVCEFVSLEAFKMYYVMRASAPSLHRESTDSLITGVCKCTNTLINVQCTYSTTECFYLSFCNKSENRYTVVFHITLRENLQCLARAIRNKNQSATLRPLPRNIATWTAQYYAVGDPVILRHGPRNITRSATP